MTSIPQDKPISRQEYVLVLLIVSASFCLKVALLYYLSGGRIEAPTFPDETNYYIPAAQALAEQGLSFFLNERSLWNGPINPLWIFVCGLNLALVKILNAALISLAGFLVWRMARRLSNSRAALLALLLYSLHAPLLFFGITLLTEPLFISLIICSQAAFILNRSKNKWLDVASGVLLALATLTRPTTQLFPIFLIGLFLCLFPWLGEKRRYYLKTFTPRLLALCLGFLVLVGPYLGHNYFSFGRATIANGFGAVLYLGNDLRKDGDEPIYSGMEFDTSEITQQYAHLDSEGDHRLQKLAVEKLKQHRFDLAWLWLRKASGFLYGHSNHYFYPYSNISEYWQANSISRSLITYYELISLSLVVSFAFWGLLRLPMQFDHKFLLGGFLLYMVALHTVAFPIPRLALPMFPTLLLFATSITSRNVRWPAVVLSLVAIGLISFPPNRPSPGTVSSRHTEYYDTLRVVDPSKPKMLNDLKAQPNGSITITGKDPYLVFEVEPLVRSVNQVVFCELEILDDSSLTKRKQRGELQVFWTSGIAAWFNEGNTGRLPFHRTKKALIYRFVLPWNQSQVGTTLGALRLDLPHQSKGLNFRLKTLKISK